MSDRPPPQSRRGLRESQPKRTLKADPSARTGVFAKHPRAWLAGALSLAFVLLGSGAVAAGILGTDARLSINFLPNAVYSPAACIQLTLKTSRSTGFPTDRLIFEFTENEEMIDTDHVRNIVDSYRKMGFTTAIDDFGAGHAGLGLLAKFQTDFIKIDMDLVRGIETSHPRQMIVQGIIRIAESLGITVIAEGVETVAEYDTLRAYGVRYIQGFLLARPGFKTLPEITLPRR